MSAPARPSVNFFLADERWANAYALAAEIRGVRHGILIGRAAIEQIARRPGFEFVEVEPRHPKARRVDDPREFWKFDIPNHRYAALHEMRFATVARLATPEHQDARRIEIPRNAVLAWW